MTQSHPYEVAKIIESHKPGFKPTVAMILGSGLGALADPISDATCIAYTDLPGFPKSGVAGHAGQLVLGYLNGVEVACLQGRSHNYEGASPDAMKTLIRTLKLIGCQTLLLTNAAGSLREEVTPGNLVMITDHINMQPGNPLVGANDDDFGPRFVGMDDVYDVSCRQALKATADKVGITLYEGIYVCTLGPVFETPAEIRAFKMMGADVVGMSTVPEVIIARHCGLKVAAISAVTNLAAGLSDEKLTHEGTLHYANKTAEKMTALLSAYIASLAHGH